MIIDLILDRRDGERYNPKKFYNEVMEYNSTFDHAFDYILEAMDTGEDYDTKKALCKYIIDQGYDIEIMYFILSNKWIIE